MESPRIPLPPGQSGPSELDELLDEELLLDELLLDEELLELDEELLLDELLLELLEELELLLDDELELDELELLEELLELDELELLLLDELLESESSPSGTPPLVYIMTALKYPRYPGSANCMTPTLPSP